MDWKFPNKGEMPELDKWGISDDVLCKIAKFGRPERVMSHEVLCIENGKWCDDFTEDYENNADYLVIIAWCYITKIEGEK